MSGFVRSEGIWAARATGGTPGSTGFVIAGTGANNATDGTTVWSNPGNIVANDAVYATCNPFSVGAVTQRLVGSNFDFSAVPAGATITSIIVRMEMHQQSANGDVHTEHTLRLSKDAGATMFGDNKASGTAWPTTTNVNRDFTFTTSMPTAAEVKSANFAAVLKATKSSGTNVTNNLRVDAVWMNVFYLA